MFEANVYDEQVVIVSEYARDGSLKQWLGSMGIRLRRAWDEKGDGTFFHV